MAMLTVLLLSAVFSPLTQGSCISCGLQNTDPVAGSDPAPPSCPDGWKANGPHCFQYVRNPLSWSDALNNCLQLGGNLASIHSLAEERFLLSMSLTGSDAGITWIGGHVAGYLHEVEFNWTDTSAPVYRHKLAQGPGPSPFCVTLEEPAAGSPQWFPAPCHRRHPSLCQNH
ncbi:type-2 ice-structuring protein-like [Esox lucius]|uniref:C-type lectin domain-containing protein n=1 Tax=Esox lucius TaxID=8010 RepID=A0A6Q2Y316_ESOLU|nr:type-2 ice-structuring protein-like [Esox lucius]